MGYLNCLVGAQEGLYRLPPKILAIASKNLSWHEVLLAQKALALNGILLPLALSAF